MPSLIQIALGGALGAMLRYAVVTQSARLFGAAFPWGTLGVNVAGSFAIGVVFVLAERVDSGWRHYAPLIAPGVLGGFTTFSASSLETLLLLERGRAPVAAAYAVASVALGVLAAAAGVAAARAGLAT